MKVREWYEIHIIESGHRYVVDGDPRRPPPPGYIPNLIQRFPDEYEVRRLVPVGDEASFVQ